VAEDEVDVSDLSDIEVSFDLCHSLKSLRTDAFDRQT